MTQGTLLPPDGPPVVSDGYPPHGTCGGLLISPAEVRRPVDGRVWCTKCSPTSGALHVGAEVAAAVYAAADRAGISATEPRPQRAMIMADLPRSEQNALHQFACTDDHGSVSSVMMQRLVRRGLLGELPRKTKKGPAPTPRVRWGLTEEGLRLVLAASWIPQAAVFVVPEQKAVANER